MARYLMVGLYINYDSLPSSQAATGLGCLDKVDREALALWMATGADFFMTENIAINVERGGIDTSAKATLTINPNGRIPVFDGSGNLSTVFFPFGVHFLPPNVRL